MTLRRALVGMICGILLRALPANAETMTKSAQLICGPAVLRAATIIETHVPPDDGFGWLSQSLTLKSSPAGPEKPISIDTAPHITLTDGRAALADVVDSWACVHGTTNDYIVLNVYCARDDFGGVCGGQREWLRILSLSGNRPDASYAPQALRYTTLFRRLGINVDGLQMRDATGD